MNPFLEISKKSLIKSYDMEELVLEKTKLIKIEKDFLKPFPNLQSLFIPNNELIELSNLDYNIRLKFIDARNNNISEINIPKQLFLTELYLSNNSLINLEIFLNQIDHLKNLEILDLRNNKLTQERGYRNLIILKFPSLKILDGINIIKKNNIIPRNINNRSSSVLTYLKNIPKSNVEININLKNKKILKKKELNNLQIEKNNSTRNINILNSDYNKIIKPKSKSRMYLKTQTFIDSQYIKKEDLFLENLNPGIVKAFQKEIKEKIFYSS